VPHPDTFPAVENLTHSLVGVTLAELALPANARPAQRGLFYATGIVAANLPDADLFYTAITPPPLGYLLHHRGHTHTVVGILALAMAMGLVLWAIPGTRRLIAESRRRFWVLLLVALASHLVLDSWNSYGVHPFWPVDNRWFYGDAIYILEPWLWVMLGVAVALNARTTLWRWILFVGLVVAVPLAAVRLSLIPSGALVALFVIGAALGLATRRASPRTRSTIALAVTASFVITMFGLSRVARAASVASAGAFQQGVIVDVVLNPRPAAPLCWTALAIEKREARGEYVMRRGSLALFDGWLPRSVCNLGGARPAPIGASRTRVAWLLEFDESLSRLRTLARNDCRVRAWLRFARAPGLSENTVTDERFGNGGFTSLRLSDPAAASVCPPHLPNWAMPRADLLEPALEK
jgi:inner membrane protein